MGQNSRRRLLVGALCTALWPGARLSALDEGKLTLTVLIDNVAHVPTSTLTNAQGHAVNVFRQADVEIRWLECSFQEAERRDPPGCQLPVDVPIVMVKILPEAEARRWTRPALSLGFCLDRDVYLLLPRVKAVAEKQNIRVPLVLGHVLAHEIGHGVLGAGHSSEGLMRAELRATDWRRAEQGRLLFTPGDAHRVREQLRRLRSKLRAAL
jgi:hypothetical protein